MPDNRLYVVKNIGNLQMLNGEVTEYLTRADENGVEQPIGFSLELAKKTAEFIGWDPDEAVIARPNDLIVITA
jgi:hypothetical protein